MPRRNHPTSAAPYTKPLSYNDEKLLNVGAIWGIANGYGCMVLVLRWCGFSGICTMQYSPENSVCDVLLRVRYMRVSSTNSDGECTLIFICRRDEAKLSGIQRLGWGLLSHYTIEVHQMITTNLVQTHMRSVDQGGEYLKCSLWHLHKPSSRYLSLRKMHMDLTSSDLASSHQF